MKVLLAVDGSPNSLRAAEQAVALFGANLSLTLINVHSVEHLRRFQSHVGREAVDGFIADLYAADLKDVKAWLDSQNVKYDTHFGHGEPAPVISEYGHSEGFDLIMMGAKGRGSVSDFIVGSLVMKLIAASKTPVLVVPN